MPRWTRPDAQDEIARLLRDIDAAQALCEVLPRGSRDREMVERTMAELNAQIVRILADDPPPPGIHA